MLMPWRDGNPPPPTYCADSLSKSPFSPPFHGVIIFSGAGVKSNELGLLCCRISFYECCVPPGVSLEGMFLLGYPPKEKLAPQKAGEPSAGKVGSGKCLHILVKWPLFTAAYSDSNKDPFVWYDAS
jgi:hypothetical protein